MDHRFVTFQLNDDEMFFSCGECGREVLIDRSSPRFTVMIPGDASVRYVGGTGALSV